MEAYTDFASVYDELIDVYKRQEYTGCAAYIFTKDSTTGTYTLNSTTIVNEIGNVMLYNNQITDCLLYTSDVYKRQVH